MTTPTPRRRIFVFGSNTKGIHGAGAAREARLNHGAILGQARGLQGNSYAIVTKDLEKGPRSIPLEDIEREVQEFLKFAREHPELDFKVNNIGCGLAGYYPREIAPFFQDSPPNVTLSDLFIIFMPTKKT